MENPDSSRDINLALLIDADNITSKYIESILAELSRYGKVTIRRMYGDWSQSRLRSWLSVSSRYSLTPVMQPNNTPGKNASDIGLIIDAMDILYAEEVQGFCIASSDGDFNKLATRIRESGKVVIGMGEKKTPESFRASCERFFFLDVLQSALEEEGTDTAYENTDASAGREEQEHTETITKQALENAIINIISDNTAQGKETGLGEIGSRLLKLYPDFDIRNYNYSRLSAFLKDFDSLSVVSRDKAVWVSLKPVSVDDIEKKIEEIYLESGVTTMNVGRLKDELTKTYPGINAAIRQAGVTKFSVFLEKMIGCIHVVGTTEAEYLVKKQPAKRRTARKKKTADAQM